MYTVEIVKDKFWILEDAGVKLGVIRLHDDSQYEVIIKEDGKTILNEKELTKQYGKNILKAKSFKKVESVEYGKDIDSVGGFPTKHVAYNKSSMNINEKTIPIYTKSEKSKVLYAAGYYGLHFENKAGWKNAYCIKAETLHTYNFIGPFRTKTELEAEIKRQ